MAQLELGLDEDFDNTGDEQLKVPGFSYYYQFELEARERFRHGANDFQQSPRLTAREVAMLGIMNALTDKPDWHKKVFDDEIVAKWKQEACAIHLISEMAWDWCLTELRDKAKRFERIGRVLVLDAGSRISKSDQRVSEALRQELKDAVKPLLDRPDAERDWHPGSDDKVLNLVHPSLFPLVYGRTRVLVNGGKVPLDLANIEALEGAEIAPRLTATSQPSRPLHGDGTHGGMWSKKFQWLPCEVEFTEDTGTNVHISSYINNLHPAHHADVYTAIEKVIALASKWVPKNIAQLMRSRPGLLKPNELSVTAIQIFTLRHPHFMGRSTLLTQPQLHLGTKSSFTDITGGRHHAYGHTEPNSADQAYRIGMRGLMKLHEIGNPTRRPMKRLKDRFRNTWASRTPLLMTPLLSPRMKKI